MAEIETVLPDVPMMEGKDGMLGVFFNLYLKLGNILQSPEFSREPIRMHFMTTLLISMIPDEIERAEVMKQREVIYHRVAKEYMESRKLTSLANDKDYNHVLVESSLQTVGLVQHYADKYMGLSMTNRLGTDMVE